MKKEKNGTAKPEKMAVKTFLDHFMRITNNKNLGRRFCFILGAGASKQSGIPTGAELVKKWVKELHEMYDAEELKQWAADNKIKDLESGEAARYYSQIYDKRFEIDPKEGYNYLEGVMEKKDPSFGYWVLAQILANTHHNVVITTNFDSLVEDALFIYTQYKPLVAGHEALAGFISPIMRRPLIAKIHRDILLAPISDSQETSRLADGWKKSLTSLFMFYKPVVIGYGGNDGSLMDFLESLEPIDGGMFWCYREEDGELAEEILQLVIKHNGYIIPIMGFDELMLQLNKKLGYSLAEKDIRKEADQKVRKYRKNIEDMQKRFSKTPKGSDVKEALISTIKEHAQEKDVWAIVLMANGEEDLDKKEEIYKQGIKEIPESHELRGEYATFLENARKKYDKAEEMYEEALTLNPDNANLFNRYANFLSNIRKKYDKAEELYKKALELDSNYVSNITNYAQMLLLRGRRNEGEKYLDRAFTLKTENLNIGDDRVIEADTLLLELWFYRYIYFPQWYDRAYEELIKLLKKGAQSMGWDLKPNIERAKKDGHPNVDRLEKLAKVISEDAPLETLSSLESKLSEKSIPDLKKKAKDILKKVPDRDVPEWDSID